MERLNVNISHLKLDNPIIPASGTFGYGKEFEDLYDINILGSISIKGTTLHERYGNELPRIAEFNGGMLNSVGLQNPGLKKVVDEELTYLNKIFKKPVLANVSGFSIDEYVKLVKAMDKVESVGIIEVNISCPNVHQGGMAFGTDAKEVVRITKAVKDVTRKPVFIKLTPNVTDIVEIAKACEAEGADGISMINTLLGMRIDIKKRKPILDNIYGGISGPAIFPLALRMVNQVSKEVNIPIIGMGGISSSEDVIEMMMAGASAVQIGAANLVNPWICKEIIEDLPNKLDELGIDNIKDIVGVV
ncbi:MAG TPA: dihydroorotate dehydrogenase [Anaerovoracaceae bacterium]|nr:dihydroorotate dehydrogenase [Anaerovoracaceae bacterium]